MQVNAILNRVQEGEEAPRTLLTFEVGEKEVVTDHSRFRWFGGIC